MDSVRVAIVLFDGVEVMDFAGPFEVFFAASRVGGRFEVVTTAPTTVITAAGGLEVRAGSTLDHCPRASIVVVPGGRGARREHGDAELVSWLASRAAAVEVTASVCTGAFLLARAGVLSGRCATTHWAYLDQLRRDFPTVEVVQERVVDAGSVVTSAGVCAGIDMALLLVERYAGRAIADQTARRIEYQRP